MNYLGDTIRKGNRRNGKMTTIHSTLSRLNEAYEAPQWAARQSCPTALGKLVLMALAYHTKPGKDRTTVSRRELSEWAGVSINTIDNKLAELEDANLIARFERTAKDGGNLPSLTVFNM